MFEPYDDWEPTMGRRGEHVETCDARPGVLGFDGVTALPPLSSEELAALPRISDEDKAATIAADGWVDPRLQARLDRVATAIREAKIRKAEGHRNWRDKRCRRRR